MVVFLQNPPRHRYRIRKMTDLSGFVCLTEPSWSPVGFSEGELFFDSIKIVIWVFHLRNHVVFAASDG